MENSTIAHRLKIFRQSTGLTQAEFGEACGISQRTYANLEGGRTKKISGDYLRQIEAAFKDLSPNWLRNGAGQMERVLPAPSEVKLPEQIKRKPIPPMAVSRRVEDMPLEELVGYYKARAEIAEEKLAVFEEAQRHEEAVHLVRSAGGRAGFNDASADAADEDYIPPVMTAETIRHDAVAATEADRIRIRRWGNLASLS